MKNIIALIISCAHTALFAQGYCALRDPQAKIRQMYPLCKSYNTLVGTIDESVRLKVQKKISLPLYFYEIGRHNLYAIKQSESPVGLVHSRSEKSPWGLVEIIWSLNLDLSVKDFAFQRCRSGYKNILLKAEFKKQLIGKSFLEIKSMIDKQGQINDKLIVANEAKPLAQILIQSALKTIAITDISWREELNKLRLKTLSTNKTLQKIHQEDTKNNDYYKRVTILKHEQEDKYIIIALDKVEPKKVSIFTYDKDQLKMKFYPIDQITPSHEKLISLEKYVKNIIPK